MVDPPENDTAAVDQLPAGARQGQEIHTTARSKVLILISEQRFDEAGINVERSGCLPLGSPAGASGIRVLDKSAVAIESRRDIIGHHDPAELRIGFSDPQDHQNRWFWRAAVASAC